MSLVNHAFAECEVRVGQVGQSFQQNLSGHRSLEKGRVKLISGREKNLLGNQTEEGHNSEGG